jgi:hypothetical protein
MDISIVIQSSIIKGLISMFTLLARLCDSNGRDDLDEAHEAVTGAITDVMKWAIENKTERWSYDVKMGLEAAVIGGNVVH